MTTEALETKIDKLITSLNELVKEQREARTSSSNTEGGGNTSPRRSRVIAREGEEIAESYRRETEALKDNLTALENEIAFRGKLSDQKQIRMAQMQEELKLLEKIEASASPKRTDKLIKQLENLKDAHQDLNEDLGLGAAKAEQLTRSILGINGEADKFAKIMPTSKAELGGFVTKTIEGVKSGEIFIRIFNKLAAEGFNLSMALDKVNAELSRETALFQETGTIMDQQARIIRDVESSNRVLGVTAAETKQAMGALQSSMADFTRMSKSDKTAILNTATVMQELGINAGTSAQIVDKATKSLGYQNSEIRGISDELHATAQSLGVPFKQIADDFNTVATELAFYGEGAIDVFKDLSKQSKATGLSMQNLLKIGGQAFNTFDGAAQKVGRLNAILGGPYLNSIDMLNASEAERIDLIKQSMDASGQMFNDLSKYEQMAISDALGVSTEEARRLFGELDAAQEMDIRKKEKMEETARKAQATMDKLTNAFMSLVVSLDFIIGPLSFIVEKFSQLIATPVGKFIGQVVLYVGGAIGAFLKLAKTLKNVGGRSMKLGNAISSKGGNWTKAGGGMRKYGAMAYKTGQTMSSTSSMADKMAKSFGRLKESAKKFKFKVPGLGKLANFLKKLPYIEKAAKTLTTIISKIPFIGPKAAQVGTTQVGTKIPVLNIIFGLISAANDLFDAFRRVMDIFDGDLGLGKGLVGIVTDLSVGLFDFLDAISFGIGGLITDLAFYVQEKIFGLPKATKEVFIESFATIPETVSKLFTRGFDNFLSMAYQMLPDWLRDLIEFFGGGRPESRGGGIINTPKNPNKVNDAIITSKGEVIEPNKQDTIFAAKPGGPIMNAMSPITDFLVGRDTNNNTTNNNTNNNTSMGQQPSNINVIVKIGERQLRDIFIDVLRDTTASSEISGFGGR